MVVGAGVVVLVVVGAGVVVVVVVVVVVLLVGILAQSTEIIPVELLYGNRTTQAGANVVVLEVLVVLVVDVDVVLLDVVVVDVVVGITINKGGVILESGPSLITTSFVSKLPATVIFHATWTNKYS